MIENNILFLRRKAMTNFGCIFGIDDNEISSFELKCIKLQLNKGIS